MFPRSRHAPSEDGASSAEYALLASLIAVVILSAVALLGGNLSKSFSHDCDSIAAAVPSAHCN